MVVKTKTKNISESDKDIVNKVRKLIKFRKNDIPKLRYAMIHTLFGYSDGVSIVMKQIEGVLVEELKVPQNNIMYLVGKSKFRSPRVTQREILLHRNYANKLMLRHFSDGYGGWYNQIIEEALSKAQKEIENFISSHNIDVLIAHNSSHPENFVSSVALSRYYRDAERQGKKTPKYILWWHDSHLERPRFEKPAKDVWRYLLEGVPGLYVEYILFINSMQFSQSQRYFLELDKYKNGFFDCMHLNHDVIYNTTDTFIQTYDDLVTEKVDERTIQFLHDFNILDTLKEKGQSLDDVLFCLQHTRVVHRKRIDFALKFSFELLAKLKKKNKFKSLYFFVSGHSAENGVAKRKIKRLYSSLCKEYGHKDLILGFAEQNKKTKIKFEEYPRIFAKLGGFSTYFSEIEGFGNNLLEVMASGLIPVLYTYPVFLKDIAKYHFKAICLSEFKIDPKSIDLTMDILTNDRKRKIWVNRNLDILRTKFSHRIIARKLQRAIIRRRIHL
ncbi:MAG: glycosyltransferase [Candidatus Woesearchaeota archaeon]